MSTHSLNAHTDYEKKMLLQDSKIHNLGSFKRVWVIGAVRGKASLFEKVCEKIINGQLIETLVDEYKSAGYYQLSWEAFNISSGIYFIKVESGQNVSTQKLMLMK